MKTLNRSEMIDSWQPLNKVVTSKGWFLVFFFPRGYFSLLEKSQMHQVPFQNE